MKLAVQGGKPSFAVEWPHWPQSSIEVESAVLRVLRSGRWAISGMNVGYESEERRFAREFADYIGVRHAVPVTNGSAALVVALEAAGVGYGDEVLVPGLVWIACAAAVTRVGAVPVFVDIDVDNFAMDPAAAAAAVTSRTAAILVAHLSSSIADLDAFAALADRHQIPLIEDCSQAHGAVWRGHKVGSFGLLATFSFQSSKLLTSGEGGIVVTNDDDLYYELQQLRADGRQWAQEPIRPGFPDLVLEGKRQGHNHCMTELQAAILSEGLRILDDQNQARIRSAFHLENRLAAIKGVRTIRRRNDARVDVPTFWHLPIQIDRATFKGADVEWVRAAISEEIGLFLEPVGAPLTRHTLYNPLRCRRFPTEHLARLDTSRFNLPRSTSLSESCFTLPHHALLAPLSNLDALVAAIAYIQEHVGSQ